MSGVAAPFPVWEILDPWLRIVNNKQFYSILCKNLKSLPHCAFSLEPVLVEFLAGTGGNKRRCPSLFILRGQKGSVYVRRTEGEQGNSPVFFSQFHRWLKWTGVDLRVVQCSKNNSLRYDSFNLFQHSLKLVYGNMDKMIQKLRKKPTWHFCFNRSGPVSWWIYIVKLWTSPSAQFSSFPCSFRKCLPK